MIKPYPIDLLTSPTNSSPSPTPPAKHRPSVIAHRGAKAEAPENTLEAFEASLHYPVAGIELDVQLSKDHIAVVFHDQTLWRFTGRLKAMAGLTYGELARLDIGSWFHRKFRGAAIPTLDSVMEQIAGSTRLFIEIKTRKRTKKENALLTQEVIRVVERCRDEYSLKPFYILSFDRESLIQVHREHPDWPCVLNIESPRKFKPADFETLPFFWGICCNINTLSYNFSRRVKEHKMALLSYTSNKPRQVRRALKMEVDMMMTDNPAWVFKNYSHAFKAKF